MTETDKLMIQLCSWLSGNRAGAVSGAGKFVYHIAK